MKEGTKNGYTTHDEKGSEVNNNSAISEKSSVRRVMLVVFVGLLMDLMAFAVILPLLPSLLDNYSKDEKVQVKHLNKIFVLIM